MSDAAARYIELFDEACRCTWCRCPNKKVYRSGLCRHCYGIKLDIAAAKRRCEKGATRVAGSSDVQRLSLDLDLKTAELMAERAMAEGVAFWPLAGRDVTGLDLEHQFSFLSNHLLRKDLFWGKANIFNHSFDADQCRLLFHFLSLLNREYERRHRRSAARSEAVMQSVRGKPNPAVHRSGARVARSGR